MAEPEEPRDPLLDLLGGKARAQAVSTAAAIGLPDALLDGPKALDQLAEALECAPRPLESLLRLLTGLGLFESPQPGHFGLTPVGRRLCQDELGPLAVYLGAPEQWDPWARLRDAMRGEPCAFERTFATGLYPYLAAHPDAAARYDAAIDSFTRHEAQALCQNFDFDGASHVVDVGGGRGTLLIEVLRRWPALRGTLFDLPHVVDAAAAHLEAACPGRSRVRGGDFFAEAPEGIPSGADIYLLKHVLHNWGDDDAIRILRRCADAAGPEGTILAIDAILAPDPRPNMTALLDLEMQVLTGGHQRRKPEMRRLFRNAGLKLHRIAPLTDAGWLLHASPK